MTTDEAKGELAAEAPRMRGLHAGALVLAGVATLNLGNYLFHVLSARQLGPARYGDLATLITISGLISLPLGGVQVWVARHVALYKAAGDDEAVQWFARRVGTYLSVAGGAVTAILLVLTWPIQSAFGIASPAAVAITALTAFPAIASPMTWGLAQGLERFRLVALVYATGPISRIGLTLVAFGIGLHVGGAMIATLVSMLIAFGLPLFVLRRWVQRTPDSGRRLGRLEAGRSLIPVMAGLLAITALTSVDVLVSKTYLSDEATGIYGTASLIGRVIFYLSAAVVTVLLPRVAARTASNQETAGLLVSSLGVTTIIAVVGTALYATVGGFAVNLAFGAKYDAAAGLLWLFGIAMSLFAILNILLVYHLGKGENRMSWLLCAGAVTQLVLFSVIHSSPRSLVLVDLAVAATLVVAHELLLDFTLLRSVARRPRQVLAD